MAETYYVDLLALLRAFKNGMQKCTLYGRLVKQTPYPDIIQPGVKTDDTGMFAIMEVFAVNLGYYSSYLRDHGLYNKDNIYMVNGNALVYVNKAQVQGVDWYQVTGTLRRPSNKPVSNCVALLNFYKENNSWALAPAKVEDLSIEVWERHSDPYAWIYASSNAGRIMHPPEVHNLPRFESFDQSSTPQPVQKPKPAPEPELPAMSTVVRTFPKENRQTIKECSNAYSTFSSVYDNAKKLKDEFLASLKTGYAKADCPEKYLKYMLDGILQYFTQRRSPYALTGRAVIKRYLETCPAAHEDYMGGRTAGEFVTDNFREFYKYVLDDGFILNADGIALDLCRSMLADKEAFYAGVVGVVIGVSHEVMTDVVVSCESYNLSITKILNENPYILQFISQLSFDEIERIALCFGRHEDTSLSRYRNTAMLNAYISNTDDGSTVYRKSKLNTNSIGVRLTSSKFDKVRMGRPYLTDAMVMNIDSYIRDTKQGSLTYVPNGFRRTQGVYYVRSLTAQELEKAIIDYVQTGLGVVKDDYLTSSDLLKKELFVFNTMRRLASQTFDYKREDIDRCIAEYEAMAGFKLEESQVKAVHLLTNGAFVVAGSAGSGKTTVSKCVVYTLRKLSPMLDIKFAAPTGKAAKRMQEVVQEECRTLHSLFHLSTSSGSIFSDEDSSPGEGNTAYFFDESAMITVDLMYRVLRSIDIDSTRICMFGDFNQLSPIGKGLPFKNLLRFMPCVFLDVVKRAAEGSNITANSQLINECSDYGKWQWLNNGKDFFLLQCGGDRIQDTIKRLCAHYLGKVPDNGILAQALGVDKLPEVEGLTPDDIQVVSPLTKDTYSWGATQLNGVLQPLFNNNRAYTRTFFYQATKFSKAMKFMIGDRVIHTDKNMYSMQWYGSYRGGTFQKIYGQGICNGEVGKVVAFMPASDAEFLEEKEPCPEGFEYTESLRHDSSHSGQNAYFVVVEYYDFISGRNFYILYRAERNSGIENSEGIVFKGEDIQKLNLFYAGTTHKLQGSQAKMIIFALDDINFGGFVTRQMVYTMITRAEKLVIGVGSVGNSKSSMMTKARLDIASADTLTVGELLV